jgi:DNA-directed RNA polymerase subunit N (RpoN/RPB10)
MLFPIRCYTCNKVVARYFNQYKLLLKSFTMEETFEKLKIHRCCCRRMFMGYHDIFDIVSQSNVKQDYYTLM